MVGAPDAERGAVVCAHVVLNAGWDAGEELARALQDHAKREIAPYKYPRRIEFHAALPRTPTDKLQRAALRELAAGAPPRETAGTDR